MRILQGVLLITFLTLFYCQADAQNRLDACIRRNRSLSEKISELSSQFGKMQSQISSQEGVVNYYKQALQTSRDSIKNIQKNHAGFIRQTNLEISSLEDSLMAFRTYRQEMYREKLQIINDTNVTRVYDLPYDQLRVRVLKKVLDEGIGLVIERNTDEGFVISKIFKDRKAKGLFRKSIESRVTCDIRMRPHPFNDAKTLFYTTTRVQEKIGKKKPYVDQNDGATVNDYQRKLLKLFDEILVGQ